MADQRYPTHMPNCLYGLQIRILKTLKQHHRALSMRNLYNSFNRKYPHLHIGMMLKELIKYDFVVRYGSKYFPAKYEITNNGRLMLACLDQIIIKPDLDSEHFKPIVLKFPKQKKTPKK